MPERLGSGGDVCSAVVEGWSKLAKPNAGDLNETGIELKGALAAEVWLLSADGNSSELVIMSLDWPGALKNSEGKLGLMAEEAALFGM